MTKKKEEIKHQIPMEPIVQTALNETLICFCVLRNLRLYLASCVTLANFVRHVANMSNSQLFAGLMEVLLDSEPNLYSLTYLVLDIP